MMRTNGVMAAMLALCFSLVGCVGPNATTEVRKTSFAAYSATKVGAVSLRQHIILRYATLTTGTEAVVATAGPAPSFHGVVTGFGSAVPIDHRGYFLTAAHCVGEGMHLVYAAASGLRVDEARVVWRGDTGAHPVDLALVRVVSPIDYAFAWAARFQVGDVVFGAGPNYDSISSNLTVETDCFAGRLSRVSAMRDAAIPYVRIAHSAPVHRGDSGSSLVNERGELVGILASAWSWNGRYVQLPFLPRGYAYRPDVATLQRIINDDYAQQSGANQTLEPGRR
jgi:S1-C subfamily serine protease